MASKTETDFNSVERVKQYIVEPEEPPGELPGDPREDEAWPRTGSVIVSKAVMRYRENLPVVLDSVSFEVRPYKGCPGSTSLLTVERRLVATSSIRQRVRDTVWGDVRCLAHE